MLLKNKLVCRETKIFNNHYYFVSVYKNKKNLDNNID